MRKTFSRSQSTHQIDIQPWSAHCLSLSDVCLNSPRQTDKYSTDPHLGYADRFQARLSSSSEVTCHLDGVGSAAQVWVDPVSACQRRRRRRETLLIKQNTVISRRDTDTARASPHRRTSCVHSCKGLGRSWQDCRGSPVGSSNSGSECWDAAGSWKSQFPGPTWAGPCSDSSALDPNIISLIIITYYNPTNQPMFNSGALLPLKTDLLPQCSMGINDDLKGSAKGLISLPKEDSEATRRQQPWSFVLHSSSLPRKKPLICQQRQKYSQARQQNWDDPGDKGGESSFSLETGHSVAFVL